MNESIVEMRMHQKRESKRSLQNQLVLMALMAQVSVNSYDPYAEVSRLPRLVSRPTRRITRNEPCPCGSGKKYKFCCIDKNQ